MNPGTQSEINYKIHVEPQMFRILDGIAQDLKGHISYEDFVRAMWTFSDKLMGTLPKTPQWLRDDVEQKIREAGASNTIDGEVGADG